MYRSIFSIFLSAFTTQGKWNGVAREVRRRDVGEHLTGLTTPVFVRALLVVVLKTISAVVLDHRSSGDMTTIKIIGRVVVLAFLIFRIVGLKASMLYSRCLNTELRGGIIRMIKISLLIGLLINKVVDLVLFAVTHAVLR